MKNTFTILAVVLLIAWSVSYVQGQEAAAKHVSAEKAEYFDLVPAK